ncbi:MAG: carboxypeptidase-like regulatory domain-containing protein, partial [Cyclobacteriaceae bacterium]
MKLFSLPPQFFLLAMLVLSLFSYPVWSQTVASNLPLFPTNAQQDQTQDLATALFTLSEKFWGEFNYDKETLFHKKVKNQLLREVKSNNDLEKALEHILSPLGLNYKKFEDNSYAIYPRTETREVKKVEREVTNPGATQGEEEESYPGDLLTSLEKLTNTGYTRLVEQTITGKVADSESGEPLPGVNVLGKGTTAGTVTDVEGNYRLNLADEVTTIVFSSIGYVSQEVAINGRSTIDVTMTPDVQSLSEVVVIGYGTVEKSDLTGAVSSLRSEDFNQGANVSVDKMLLGREAGVQITQTSSEPGGGQSIRIREASSICAGNEPKYVIDGFPID